MNANLVPSRRRPATYLLLAGIMLWLTLVVWAAHSGALTALGGAFMPGLAVLVGIGIAVPVVLYRVFRPMRRAIDAFGLHRLTVLHVWRIAAAALFYFYGLRGDLPGAFWLLAGTGDLLAGGLAATALWRPRTLALYRRIHRFGFADFIIAVGTGLIYTLVGDPRMALLTTLPMAPIPLFGVGLSRATHIIVLTRLIRNGDDGPLPLREPVDGADATSRDTRSPQAATALHSSHRNRHTASTANTAAKPSITAAGGNAAASG